VNVELFGWHMDFNPLRARQLSIAAAASSATGGERGGDEEEEIIWR
jgi:hypothetical protein